MTRTLERRVVVALCALIAWFYVWTVRSSGEEWAFGSEHRDYYNLLIDGYLDGQLHMKVKVPEALLQLRNPYDPQERPAGLGLHDASFYKGRYYVYFGAAPMIVLMLPFRVLTGMDLPLTVAVLVFVFAGFVITVALWGAVRRRYFAETTTVTVVLGILVLGIAGPGPVILRRPDMWELPIAGGYCFAMLALAFIWRSLHAERTRARWFAAAALALGLAIASRPTYLVATPLLGVPLFWWWRQDRRLPWRLVLQGAVPLAVIGALMGWHNHARFDHPLEFGQAYQFSLDYESKLPHFRAAYVPYTAKAHFFSAANWTAYSPFIHRADLGPAPQGFTMHRGDVYGIFVNFPVAWLAFLAPLAWWRRTPAERGALSAWLGSVTSLFVLMAGVLLFFFSALARYQMDFAPALMLLACVGLLALERWLEATAPAWARAFARAGWMAAGSFSVLFGVLLSLQFDGLLREHNPPLERVVARRLDRISAVLERIIGVRHGPVEITLRLPTYPKTGAETLLTVGQPPLVDRVIVRYASDERVQFGGVLRGGSEQLSRPMPLRPGESYRLRVALGSLYPRAEHPSFASASPADLRQLKSELRLELNDEPVLIGHHREDPLPSPHLAVGAKAAADPAYPPFRGTVLKTQRGGDDPPGAWRAHGPFVRLRLSFKEASDAACEPLLSFGGKESGAVLTMRRLEGEQVKFALQGRGAERIESELLQLRPGRAQELVVRFERMGPKQRRMLLSLDAQLVWAPRLTRNGVENGDVTVGRDEVGVIDCAPVFRGTVLSSQHDRQGGDPLRVPGNLRLRVRLPANRAGQREPLVVTGRAGQGDILLIEYVDAQTVRFGLDHWGAPLILSEPVSIDFAREHTIDVAMESLQTIADAALSNALRPGKISVAIDGRGIWTHSGWFFPAEAPEVALGRNPIGGTVCGPVFGGEILAAERVPRE